MKARLTKLIASSSSLACLAALLAILPLSFSYPVIPYLKFDLAEIPVVLALLLIGPEAGAVSSITYWLMLLLVGSFSPLSFTPLGPTMKFAATGSTILGLWLGFKLLRSPRGGMILGFILSCLIRVAVMSIFNYFVLLYMLPELLGLAATSISVFLGVSFSSEAAAFMIIMLFTAIFNILHIPLSILPAYLIVKSIIGMRGKRWITRIWYAEVVRLSLIHI